MSPNKKNDISKVKKKGRFAIIIPVYNHAQSIENVIKKSLMLGMPVFVVNDGSTDSIFEKIINFNSIYPLHHNENRGKGAAITTGFVEAAKVADWAITIDADGQHNPEDSLEMIQAIPESERPIVLGMREGMMGKDVPWTSRFGRKFSNFWVLLSGGPKINDSQCGFRIYPLPEVLDLKVIAKRFQFEVEILVKARWKKISVIEAPISVNYAPRAERISHFRPFIDFLRNFGTFARLIIQRMMIPSFIRKRW